MKSFSEHIEIQVNELPEPSKFEAVINCETEDEFKKAMDIFGKTFDAAEATYDQKTLSIKVVTLAQSHKKMAKRLQALLTDGGLKLMTEAFPAAAAPLAKTLPGPGADIAKLADVQQKQQAILLDPDMDREVFICSDEIDGVKVVYKTIGMGFNKPIQVYLNGSRWELFVSLKVAKKETKKYLDTATAKDIKNDVQSPIIDDWDAAQAIITKEKQVIAAPIASIPPKAKNAKKSKA